MSNEMRDIQRKLRMLQHAGKIGIPAKRAGILGVAGQASTDSERREEARRDKLQ